MQAVKVESQIRVRKERNDKGKGRMPYKRSAESTEAPVSRVKRSYVFRNVKEKLNAVATLKKGTLSKLSRYERALVVIMKENQTFINAMADGSVPFLVGLVVSRYGMTFVNELGTIRTRLISKSIQHLEQAGILKVEGLNRNLTQGSIQLV